MGGEAQRCARLGQKFFICMQLAAKIGQIIEVLRLFLFAIFQYNVVFSHCFIG